MTNYWNGINNQRNTGGSAIGWLVFLAILIPMVVGSALSSLFVALALPKYIKTVEPNAPSLTFNEAYKILFRTILLFEALVFICLLLFTKSSTNGFSFTSTDSDESGFLFFFKIILCQLPALLLASAWLSHKLPSDYVNFKGFNGYLRTTVVALVMIMPVVMLVNYILANIFYHLIAR